MTTAINSHGSRGGAGLAERRQAMIDALPGWLGGGLVGPMPNGLDSCEVTHGWTLSAWGVPAMDEATASGLGIGVALRRQLGGWRVVRIWAQL